MIRHILQAKVNVLIQNNRIEQQRKEKDRQLTNKLKIKDSFSQYEEPSKKGQVKEVRVVRINEGFSSPQERQYSNEDMQKIYEKRFNQMEIQKYRRIPIEELRKEQKDYTKIIQNINKKIQQITCKTVEKQPSPLNSRKAMGKDSLERGDSSFHYHLQKENINTNKEWKRNQRALGRRSIESKSQESQEMVHESEMNGVKLTQLYNESAHLQEQLRKYLGEGGNQSLGSVQMKAEQLEEKANEVRKVIKDRKRWIIDLNLDIATNSKVLVREEYNEVNEEDKDQSCNAADELRLLIHKKTAKNHERNQYLTALIHQNQSVLDKIKEIDAQRRVLSNKQSQEIIATKDLSTINTNFTETSTPNRSKLKHLTTLQMEKNSNIQQKSNSLLKKKEAVLKIIKREDRRWKTVYTQKMKQLVSEYSNLKDISNLGLKIEIELHGKEQQMSHLRGKPATEYHD